MSRRTLRSRDYKRVKRNRKNMNRRIGINKNNRECHVSKRKRRRI